MTVKSQIKLRVVAVINLLCQFYSLFQFMRHSEESQPQSIGLCLSPDILKNITFRKLHLFQFSVWEAPILLGQL
jgi:hypothetical protein